MEISVINTNGNWDILDIVELPPAEDIEIDDEGNMTYLDRNGNAVYDPVHQDIIDMTEEEIEEDYDAMMNELQNLINDKTNSTNSNGNSGTNNKPNDSDNNWSSNLAPGEVGVDANGEEIINSAGDYEQFLKDMDQVLKDHGYNTDGSDHNMTEEEFRALQNAMGMDK